jgi:hypothetical protein
MEPGGSNQFAAPKARTIRSSAYDMSDKVREIL